MESISEKELIQRATVQAHEDRALIAQLRSIRTSKEQSEGLTQKVVAERMGTDQSNVSRLENGQSNITMRTLREYLLSIGAGIRYTVVDYGRKVELPAQDASRKAYRDHDNSSYFKVR